MTATGRIYIISATGLAIALAGACGSDVLIHATGSGGSNASGGGAGSGGSDGGNTATSSGGHAGGNANGGMGSGTGGSGTGGMGTGGTGTGGMGTGGIGTQCTTADQCRLYSSYCTTAQCVCFALSIYETDPVCNDGEGTCYVDPCSGKTASCVNGYCAVDGGAMGVDCQHDGQCAGALKCCYPCGTDGCSNKCMLPEPGTMDCPLFP